MINSGDRRATLYAEVGAHLQAGRGREAALACKALCEAYPGFAGGWYLGSIVAQRVGNLPKAREYIERALLIEPGRPSLLVQQALVLLYMDDVPNAQRVADAVAASCGDDAPTLAALGNFYLLLNRHECAVTCYRRSLALQPQHAAHWLNLATALRFLGRLDEAEQAYDSGLTIDPHNYDAYYQRAGLRRQSADRNHIATLEKLLDADGVEWKERVQLCYALAKECEDIGAYARSFAYLRRGADLQRANMAYDVADDVATVDEIIKTYTPGICRAVDGDNNREPIFIVGLPRTGTTLVDRILSSHSTVFAAGELNNFALEMTRLIQRQGSVRSKSEAIAASLHIDFAQLGKNYIDSTRPQTGHSAHFIDKMPLNYLYCGLIAKALPNAKIIELVRHPLDTCYAIYKQLFTLAYPFSYDLDDLAQYYLAYVRLMQHWHAALPGRILRVRYEDVVDNQEQQTRRLLQYCELDWEDGCLAFEKNRQASTTASAVQVREPIYRSSLGKWRHVQHELQPLIEKLRAGLATLPDAQLPDVRLSEVQRYSLD